MGLRKTWETLRHIGMKVTGSLTRPLGRNVENVEYYCQDPDCGKDITRKGGTVVIATSKVYCLEPLPCSRKGQREAMRTGQDPDSRDYITKNGLDYALQKGVLTLYERL